MVRKQPRAKAEGEIAGLNRSKWFVVFVLCLIASFVAPDFVLANEAGKAIKSTCYGTSADGWLKDGVQLPSDGPNFVSYSTTAELLGRTYVHSAVRDIVVEAYKQLETTAPDKVYKYAETGFKEGGLFKPHKTHKNGLSVDFMVPVVDEKGRSVHLPTHYLNKLGYSIEFDEVGQYEQYALDYEALAAHVVALHKAAVQKGFDVRRVIFDPVLQPFLFSTSQGAYLKKHVQFSKKRSWVRHDEHYHVDFEVPCKPLSPSRE